MTDIQTLRILKCLADEGGTLPLWKVTGRTMQTLKKDRRRRVLKDLAKSGLIDQQVVRRVNGAGPPGLRIVLTDRGRRAYLEGMKNNDAFVVKLSFAR